MNKLGLRLGDLLWTKIYRPALFKRDPEDAHNAVNRRIGQIQESPTLLRLARYLYRSPHADGNPVRICRQKWHHPVGIGPGIDKNAEQIPFWNEIAGSIEIGGVTPLPQDGRPKPRLFRIQGKTTSTGESFYALVNRMEYPSAGAIAVAQRLADTLRRHQITIPVIVQLAPNSATIEKYELSRRLDIVQNDYTAVARAFLPILRPDKDFLSVGISPNTPGLRELFVDRTEEFVQGLSEGLRKLARGQNLPPLIYKLPPFIDLGIDEKKFEEMVGIIAQYADGIAATNTLTDKRVKGRHEIKEEGGVSGNLLKPYAFQTHDLIARAIERKHLNLSFVALGGIMSRDDVYRTLLNRPAGIQLVSWLTRDGPTAIHKALEAINSYI